MRLSILAIASVAGVAYSQTQELPACARSCVTSFTSGSKIGDCNSLDIPCICGSASFLSDIACCLVGLCNEDDQKKATDFALSFCKAAAVTNLPTAVSCTTGTAAQTVSKTSSSGTAATSDSASTSSPASSSDSASTSDSAATSGSTSSITSAPASVQSQSESSTASSSPTSTPNAGAQNMAVVGAGLVGGVAAFAAALL